MYSESKCMTFKLELQKQLPLYTVCNAHLAMDF